jgi:hypothetical protein
VSARNAGDPLFDSIRLSTSIIVAAVIIGACLTLRGILPRREWRPVTPDGRAIVVHDRWTGRFQRVTFHEGGKLELSDVYVGP